MTTNKVKSTIFLQKSIFYFIEKIKIRLFFIERISIIWSFTINVTRHVDTIEYITCTTAVCKHCVLNSRVRHLICIYEMYAWYKQPICFICISLTSSILKRLNIQSFQLQSCALICLYFGSIVSYRMKYSNTFNKYD